MLTWPAYKACEPHVVLLSVCGLALLAIVAPAAWVASWKAYVAGMAALAPLLATARIARAVNRGAVEAEFARWFRPETEGPGDDRARRALTRVGRADIMDG